MKIAQRVAATAALTILGSVSALGMTVHATSAASCLTLTPNHRACITVQRDGRTTYAHLVRPMATLPPPSAAPITPGDLVISALDNSVDEYTPSGTFVQRLMDSSNGLGLPTGSAFDSSGNLYVTDFSNNQVLKRDAVTGMVTVFSDNTILGDALHPYNAPESIAFSADDTKMFISDANRGGPGGGIHVVSTATGAELDFYPIATSSGSAGIGESDWLAFNKANTLFMTNENPIQGVMQVDMGTKDIVQPSFVPSLSNTGFAISFDKNGNLWIGDTNNILEYSPDGTTLLKTITNPSFSTVFAAVFNPAGDQFFAGDIGTGIVYDYDLSGSLIGSFTASGGGVTGISVFGAPLANQPTNTPTNTPTPLLSATNTPVVSTSTPTIGGNTPELGSGDLLASGLVALGGLLILTRLRKRRSPQ